MPEKIIGKYGVMDDGSPMLPLSQAGSLLGVDSDLLHVSVLSLHLMVLVDLLSSVLL